jgi:hypothetical protein
MALGQLAARSGVAEAARGMLTSTTAEQPPQSYHSETTQCIGLSCEWRKASCAWCGHMRGAQPVCWLHVSLSLIPWNDPATFTQP